MPNVDKVSPEVVERVYEALVEESAKATATGGWVGGIYVKLEGKGISHWQTRVASQKLVDDGRIERQGKGNQSMWRPKQTEAELPEGPESAVPEQLVGLKSGAEAEVMEEAVPGAAAEGAAEKAEEQEAAPAAEPEEVRDETVDRLSEEELVEKLEKRIASIDQSISEAASRKSEAEKTIEVANATIAAAKEEIEKLKGKKPNLESARESLLVIVEARQRAWSLLREEDEG